MGELTALRRSVTMPSIGAWLSLVERTVRDREVGGSNPLAPTIVSTRRPVMVAAEIVVEGRVQGVGFRDFAHRKASLLGLRGYVMNLKDGRVRVRVEGRRETIEELVRELRKGPPLSQIDDVNVAWMTFSGRFASFSVRYAEFDR
jgi:acylphosphatase